MDTFASTTVLLVRRDGRVCMASDGQVTMNQNTIVKSGARKIRRAGKGQVLVGFAGGGADTLALFARLEAKLEEFGGNLERAVVELASVPVSATLARHFDRPAARSAVIAGGDDYELCFTASRAQRAAIDRISRRSRIRLSRIGSITRPRRNAPLVTVVEPEGRLARLDRAGYSHF